MRAEKITFLEIIIFVGGLYWIFTTNSSETIWTMSILLSLGFLAKSYLIYRSLKDKDSNYYKNSNNYGTMIKRIRLVNDEDVERWATEIDTLWNSSLLFFFLEDTKLDIEDKKYDVVKIKYQDITYQMMYDLIKTMIDSTYYTFENLNKYDTHDDFIEGEFPRLKEFSDELDKID